MQSGNKNPHRYDDIIGLPHPEPVKHPRMDEMTRAAQFAPFAALTGYEDVIEETGRLTDRRIELDENEKALLDEKLQLLFEQKDAHPKVCITSFVPDEKKAGGAYVQTVGRVKKLDAYERVLIMEEGSRLPLDDIVDIK
jgi:hypothetical protein